jgi:hypothetical protein
MGEVMQQVDAEGLVESFVKVFTDFWSRDRLFLRRVHGIAAVDPELGAAVEARNYRRRMAAGRVVDRLGRWSDGSEARDRTRSTAVLWALTSFEFFDALAEGSSSLEDAAHTVLILVKRELAT